jgi:RNA polymerase sigma-70 factor, ECF subfamily
MQRRFEADAENDPGMNSVADEELMLRVRNGDGEMLGVLFDRYRAPLFNFYARLMGDREVGEDLVQEVFLRILRYRQSYQPGTPFRPWIYQIARNARMDHYRKSPRQAALEPEMAPPVAPPDSAQQKQEAALLHRALQQLPEEKREILILARFQELKYEEIAGLVGCELNAVKTRVHRALQDLRKAFRQLEQGIREPGCGPAAPDISVRRSGQ